jgi:hypothetical protein
LQFLQNEPNFALSFQIIEPQHLFGLRSVAAGFAGAFSGFFIDGVFAGPYPDGVFGRCIRLDVRRWRRAPTMLTAANDLAIRRALEEVGVEFIEENGGGPGVRLRKPLRQKP